MWRRVKPGNGNNIIQESNYLVRLNDINNKNDISGSIVKHQNKSMCDGCCTFQFAVHKM